MTPTTITVSGPSRTASARTRAVEVTQSEWTKLRSVRSTYWTFAAAIAGMLGIGALIAVVLANNYRGMSLADKASFDPTSASLTGVSFAQLAIGVLGVLAITSEYGTGLIRTTFAAVPNRRLVLAAKATVFGMVTAVVGILSSVAAFFIGQAIFSTQGIQATLGDPGALRKVVGAGLYLAVVGLLALGLGVMIRRTAAALTAIFGVILVLPVIVGALGSAGNEVAKFLPSEAGQAIFRSAMAGRSALSPWVGFSVFVTYALVALLGGAFLIVHRDTQ